MRKRLSWVLIGVLLGVFGPGYWPLAKSSILWGLAYVRPGSLEYCGQLGRHIAEILDRPDEWRADDAGGIKHAKLPLAITVVGNIVVGDAGNIAFRLSNYDRDVIKKRAAAVLDAIQERENAVLVKQLDLQNRLKIDARLAAALAK